jgi:hypothetical protein
MTSSIQGSIRSSAARWAAAGAAAIAAALIALAPAPGRAQAPDAGGNSIERVDATQTGTGVFLTIQLKEPIAAVPASFSVTNPARVALDLPLTINNLGRSAIEINQGDLRSVNVVQAQGRSRVVLNLRRPLPYTVSVQGNTVQVALGANNESPTFPASAPEGATAGEPAWVPAWEPLGAGVWARVPMGTDSRAASAAAASAAVPALRRVPRIDALIACSLFARTLCFPAVRASRAVRPIRPLHPARFPST